MFDYDANGIRTRKIQYNAEGGIDYFVDYVWSDGKIVSQLLVATLRGTSNNEPIEVAVGPIASKVVYDDNGIPQGFTCGSACFGFVRNLQGDVIALVDYDGNIVAEYSYDPWGNIEYHISEDVNELEALIITALCPLTYRGYNYDFTTGLYYLQSRYYNPEWGRFINCDDYSILFKSAEDHSSLKNALSTPTDNNANLFVYCGNNPINRTDYSGMDFTSIDLTNLAHFIILLVSSYFYDTISISSDKTSNIKSVYYNSQKGGISVSFVQKVAINGYLYTLRDYFEWIDECVDAARVNNAVTSVTNIFAKEKKKTNKLDSNIGFDFIAQIATIKFYDKFPIQHNIAYENSQTKAREFLFSDECVSKEIKGHYLVWIASKEVSWIIPYGSLYEYFDKNVTDRAEVADIYEQDVLDYEEDSKWFNYKEGIREKYINTLADPYYNNGKRTDTVRQDWKTTKIPDDII